MLLIAYGTRPEYIKIKPILYELDRNNIQYKTLFTGQHKDIGKFDSDFSIELKEITNNRLNSILINCLSTPEYIFDNITHILVQGDTTSVLGLSMVAMHRKIKIIHLEAGLRSFDNDNPYPEEYNRKLVSNIADIHLCPTKSNEENLFNENVKDNVFVIGNTVLDNLVHLKNDCEYQNKILITLHRRENHDKIDEWFKNINDIAKEYSNIEFILPIHPNPNVSKHKDILTNVNVIEPLSHDDLLDILIKCKLVITDSGGLQEECSFFNKKTLVCRKKTERVESVNKSSFLVKEPQDLKGVFEKHINDYIIDIECPYGDGRSSEKIIEILKRF